MSDKTKSVKALAEHVNKITLQLLFLMIVSALQGQTYKPMLVNGNSWNVLYTDPYYTVKCGIGKPATLYQKETEIVKISGDTILAGKTYKKILSSMDTSYLYWELRGFSREDTATQKVYFTFGREYDEEFVLYDFLLQPKDSTGNIFFSVVESVDSVWVGNTFTKRINFKNGNQWIEGVGDINGPFETVYPILICGNPPNTKLLCVLNNDSLFYRNLSTGLTKCSYWEKLGVGIESQTEFRNYEISPNPAVSYLRIHANNQEYFKIEMIDLEGKLLLEESNIFKDALVNVANLHPGLYFARISSNNRVVTYKVIKK